MTKNNIVNIERTKPGLGTTRRLIVLIRDCVDVACACLGIEFPVEINIRLTDDEDIHKINLEQRGVDRPTDVLSFPTLDWVDGVGEEPDDSDVDFDTGAVFIGDMVLSLERCRAQAEEYGHSFRRECAYLTVHSVLHMFGYDHLDEGKRKRMMRELEEYILQYIEV